MKQTAIEWLEMKISEGLADVETIQKAKEMEKEKDTDFRIGNYVHYKIVDRTDERKEWFTVDTIDHNDLYILSKKDEMNQDYQFINLTDEWFYDFGFLLFNSLAEKNGVVVNKLLNPLKYSIFGHEIKYVHELQNWYFLLTNEELTLKSE